MNHKKLLWSLLAIIVLWSCGKDDDPAPPAASPTIANFTPESGPVGTEITITGTNFSTTLASNTVKIGTATATVTAATATQLKATVPTGATTAKVTVTVGGNTATSTKDFTVTVPNEDDPNGDDPNGDDPNGDDPDGDDPDGDDPTNEAPTAEDQSFEVAEDESLIGSVEGSDPEGDELTFALLTDESELFQVAENGEITLAEDKNLDFENATEHTLTLSVSDGTNEPVEFTVTVTVTNVIDTLFEDPASFILKFDVVAGEELEIGLNTDYEYDYVINWGDGTEENYTTNENPTHEYAAQGEYLVAIKGVFPALQMSVAGNQSGDALIDVTQWGTQKWKSMAGAFYSCSNLVDFSATDEPDFSETTSMNEMFFAAFSFNGAIGNWLNYPNLVNNLEGMFGSAHSFNQDISDWNTSNVTNMKSMFSSAVSFNQGIGNWNVEKVTDMSFMFNQAEAFNQDLSNWNPISVTNMNSMFQFASAFNRGLSGWNTSNVTNMSFMFSGASSFNKNLGPWNISKVTTMANMLNNCGMNATNYSDTLIGWASKGGAFIPDGITLGATGLKYCGADVETTHSRNTVLVGTQQWTIVGDSSDGFCLGKN